MPQTNYTPILIYASGTTGNTPAAGNLTNSSGGSELAINYFDGKLFYKDASNVVRVLASRGTGTIGGSNNQVQYNSSGVLAGSANLTFDGTSLTVGAGSGNPFARINGGTTAGQGGGYAIDRNSTEIGGLYSGSWYTSGAAAVNTVAIGTTTTEALLFGINYTEQMRLTSTGLGIGTSSPSSTLHVQRASYGVTAIFQAQDGTGNPRLAVYGSSSGTTIQNTWSSGASNLIFANGGAVGSGTEVARFDSSGNLGLGVTPSAWASMTALQVKQAALVGYFNQNKLMANSYFNGSAYTYIASDYASELRQDGGRFEFYTAPSGTAGNAISFTQAMTLTSTGNLQLGGTSDKVTGVTVSGSGLTVQASGAPTIAIWDNTDASYYTNFTQINEVSYIWNIANGAMIFATNNTERARITSGGDFYVGTANALTAAGKISVAFDQASAYGLILRNTNATATSIFVSFENSSGGSNGNISQTNSTTVAYNTSSDRRLKKDIAPAPQAGADIDAIEVVSHGWVSNNDVVKYGVVAQDLHAVAPQAVSAGDNGDEIERTWGVDYSKLVPMLIKEIQSLRARVAALEAQP